ncbi:MAG: glycosyltransferase [Chitinivibrionales bacterium]|nr:glycosyltransferase [Chitinivibrionales bacterium]MBD3356445.1 glycosyltransferase [Chitinivibrionales bacterium]
MMPPEKPNDWTGKTWACFKGAQAADGEYLLFVDADVWLEEDGLVRLGSAVAHEGGVVSVQPYHQVRTFFEQFSAFFHIMLMSGIGAFTPLGDRMAPAGLFGQCLFCTRRDYFFAGGHEKVKGNVLENLSLGRVFREADLSMHLYGGRGTLNVRMYPDGLGALIDGWSKAFIDGAGASKRSMLVLGSCWISGCIIAAASLPTGMGCRTRLPLSVYGIYAAQTAWMLRRLGAFRLSTALLFPLHCLFFCATFLYSALRVHVFRTVRWKGRRVERPNGNTRRDI